MADPAELGYGTPYSIDELFETYLNEGDLERLVGLYEPDAVFIDRDGTVLSGLGAIRDNYRRLLSMKPRIRINHLGTIGAGDVAVLLADWKLSGTAPDGTSFMDSGRTHDIVRRRADGTWRFVVDNPWGVTSPGVGGSRGR